MRNYLDPIGLDNMGCLWEIVLVVNCGMTSSIVAPLTKEGVLNSIREHKAIKCPPEYFPPVLLLTVILSSYLACLL